jgi:hypothetical protein
VSFSGTWGNPNSPCLELISKTLSLVGTSDLSSGGCASMGARTFGSTNATTAALVQ